MPTPFSSDDLGRVFDGRVLTRGRTLVLLGAVEVSLDGDTVRAVVEDQGQLQTASITPSLLGRRVVFVQECSCKRTGCVHLAAASFAALDRYPALRKAEQTSFFDRMAADIAPPERQRLVIEVAVAEPPHACSVAFLLQGERSGETQPTSPRAVILDMTRSEEVRGLARLVGGGTEPRTGVKAALVPQLLGRLARSGLARWQATGKRLVAGTERSFDSNAPPNLPPGSAVILSQTGPWYVDGATGAVGPIRLRRPAPPSAPVRDDHDRHRRRTPSSGKTHIEPVIVEQPVTPVLRLGRMDCPDEFGRLQRMDVLTLAFDYGGAVATADDERQFLRVDGHFIRRDPAAEAAALDALRQDGFLQIRVADKAAAKGRRVFVFRGREAGESWQRFVAERVPELESQGWRSAIDRDFGPRQVEQVGACDVRIADAAAGGFSLEFGIEIDGVREALLPILNHLLARGGIDAARIVDEQVITSLEDGRIVKLPAERIRRLLAIMGDLIEAAQRTADGAIMLPDAEAPTVLDLEDLLATRWENAAAIKTYVDRFRGQAEIPPAALPASFATALRPYQQHGVDWLQHLRVHGLSGFLADDMGLGKTAQTIAHIAIEHDAGRLQQPALIVVPTSLVPNWTAELAKFAPHLQVVVLHGLDRHQRRGQLAGVHVVITTYMVLARDIEAMKDQAWHMVVLDEAQAIKSPDAKATRAVCQLQAGQRLCLSGTPIENNLDELWSQFAFLMPGLLGARRDFTKRFRTPIEKKGSDVRRLQLIRRIKPFILRRTKSEVATELPAKHTILRRITLAPEQRELYETIRLTLHDKVREQIAARSLAQSRIVVLDALLKLRQACCDPRLVKLPSARLIETSSKLDELLEMLGEMVPEGRRILVFSQFTSMLDLIAPRLTAAGIPFVQLRGDTRDRAAPVEAFQAGDVPVFLISLRAGGRGLNLTAADTVVHYDPWWNPAVEDQASDRAHRIGQTRSVFVFKLVAADTVEERILELQQKKAALANIAFTDESEIGLLGFDDIDYLFQGDMEREAA
jgi:superfamily II DNA or RNA helicase